jgi:hypothetical protein
MPAATRRASTVSEDFDTYARQAPDALQAAMVGVQQASAPIATYAQQANQLYALEHDWQALITEIQTTELPFRQLLQDAKQIAVTMITSESYVTQQDLLAKICKLSSESMRELDEFIEDLLDKDENRRDILARQRHIGDLRAKQNAEV